MFEGRTLRVVLYVNDQLVEADDQYSTVTDVVKDAFTASGRSRPEVFAIPDGGGEPGTVRSLFVEGGDEGGTIRWAIDHGEASVVDLTSTNTGRTRSRSAAQALSDTTARAAFVFVEPGTAEAIGDIAAEFVRAPVAELFIIEVDYQ